MNSFYDLLRFFLFKFSPETAHALSLRLLKLMPGFLFVKTKEIEWQKKIMGIDFSNRVGLAAGLDKNGDYLDTLAKLGFGFIEVGTVTPQPQLGNPKPRLFRLTEEQALINRMGFNNKGVDYLLENIRRAKFKGVLGINIGKNFNTNIDHAISDYLACLRKVYGYASYVVINISSPNTPELRNLQKDTYLDSLLFQLKKEQGMQQKHFGRYVPLVVKVSPDLTEAEIKNMAALFIEHRVDGVIATNTTVDRLQISNSKFADEAGGLSGKPLTQLSTTVIKQFYAALDKKIPIIASGGVMTADDALDKLDAGAELVQVYTGFIYRGPGLIREISLRLAKQRLKEVKNHGKKNT